MNIKITDEQLVAANVLSGEIRAILERFLASTAHKDVSELATATVAAHVLVSYGWRYAALAKIAEDGIPNPDVFANFAKTRAEENPLGELVIRFLVERTEGELKWQLAPVPVSTESQP